MTPAATVSRRRSCAVWRLAGRLDIDSVGLLVLTQDGRVARQLIGEDSTVDKEYLVRVVYQAPGQALPRHPSERSAPLQEIDERDPVSTNVQAVFPPNCWSACATA
jgi:23S rRNA pseudouridine2604 synthase